MLADVLTYGHRAIVCTHHTSAYGLSKQHCVSAISLQAGCSYTYAVRNVDAEGLAVSINISPGFLWIYSRCPRPVRVACPPVRSS